MTRHLFIRDVLKMKKINLIWSCLLLGTGLGFSQPAVETGVDAFVQNQRLGRGVNILGMTRFGAHGIRRAFRISILPVVVGRVQLGAGRSPSICFHESNQQLAVAGILIEVLNWVLVNADKQGLNVILDLDEYGAMGADPATNQVKFLVFWRQIAQRYRTAPPSVFFELLNEPSHKMTPGLWNEYLKDALAMIREKDTKRTIIIGPAFWNSIEHLKELELPDDPNLIVTIHYYQPMDFTHQAGVLLGRPEGQVGVDWWHDKRTERHR